MIGIQLDGHGYSLVGRRCQTSWGTIRRSRPSLFYCEKGVSDSDLYEVGKQLLSLVGSKNRVSLCLGPGFVKRLEFVVPAAFSAINVYAWVEQSLESWLGAEAADSYFDYVPATQGNQTDHILYSVQRSVVDQYLQPLSNARLNLVRLEVAEQTVPRLFSGLLEGDIMLADIGAKDTDVYAISAGCCQWLGTIRSPVAGRSEYESVEIFQAGIQRFIVSLNRSPASLVLAGPATVTSKMSRWLQPMLPGIAVQLAEELSRAPGEALLAASSALS